MPGASSDRNGQHEQYVGRQLHLSAKAARDFHAQRLAAAGSSFGVWTVLASLHNGGPMIQRELAEFMGIEGPTLTRYLVRMEADGLIVRRPSVKDRRAALVEATPAGTALFLRLVRIAIEGQEQMLIGFSPEEVSAFYDMLLRVERNVRARPGASGSAGSGVDEVEQG